MAFTFPDFSELSLRNPDEHDCKKCPYTKSGAVPANCWNNDPQPYLSAFQTWKAGSYGSLMNYFQTAQAQGDYAGGKAQAQAAFNWAQDALNDLSVHEAWIQHMKSNWTLDRRCCVSRTGGDNFNNYHVPIQENLRSELSGFRDQMQDIVFQFDSVQPPPGSTTGTGDPLLANQFGADAAEMQAAQAGSSKGLIIVLVVGAVLLIGAGVYVIRKRK